MPCLQLRRYFNWSSPSFSTLHHMPRALLGQSGVQILIPAPLRMLVPSSVIIREKLRKAWDRFSVNVTLSFPPCHFTIGSQDGSLSWVFLILNVMESWEKTTNPQGLSDLHMLWIPKNPPPPPGNQFWNLNMWAYSTSHICAEAYFLMAGSQTDPLAWPNSCLLVTTWPNASPSPLSTLPSPTASHPCPG